MPGRPSRRLSAVLAFAGMGFFLAFALLSWLTGGYDDIIGMAGKSWCGCLMAREVAPCLVCYSQWPGHSGVQVGAIHFDSQRDSFVVRLRPFCAFSACDSQFPVSAADYRPNWYDRHHNKLGADIEQCPCSDCGASACCRSISRCGVSLCLRSLGCCLGRKTGAAMIGMTFIALETIAFSLLVLSVAAEAVSVTLHAEADGTA